MVRAFESAISDRTAERTPAVDDPSFREACQKTYRWMLLARALDEKMASLYRAGKIHGGVFLGRGQEALSASAGHQLRRGDIFGPLIRALAGRPGLLQTLPDAT